MLQMLKVPGLKVHINKGPLGPRGYHFVSNFCISITFILIENLDYSVMCAWCPCTWTFYLISFKQLGNLAERVLIRFEGCMDTISVDKGLLSCQ